MQRSLGKFYFVKVNPLITFTAKLYFTKLHTYMLCHFQLISFFTIIPLINNGQRSSSQVPTE